MAAHKRRLTLISIGTGLMVLLVFLIQTGARDHTQAAAPGPELALGAAVSSWEVEVSDPVVPVSTGNVRDLPLAPAPQPGDPVLEIPRLTRERAASPEKGSDDALVDPLLAVQAAARVPIAVDGFETPILNVNGQGFTGVNPPDTVGDVGPNHYIQMVNHFDGTQFIIYDKSGGIVQGPSLLDLLAGGATQCSDGNGDPIVLYDHLADRWMMSEFDTSRQHFCVYISQTPDPTGAFWLYDFVTPPTEQNDYPKYGVWPDAYYVSSNELFPANYAFDRTQMLAGLPATSQRFVASPLSGFGFQALIPSDLDGVTTPPTDSPNYFIRHRDDEVHNTGSNNPTEDYLEIYEFNVDFATPANSTFSLANTIPIAEFDSDLCGLVSYNCFPQPGTSPTLDPLREVIMWRLQYRNFGTHETLVGNFVTDVDGTDHGGVRWFELRKSGAGNWSLYQEGTYAPDSVNRWMGGIAMDSRGNIAVGYNVSDRFSTYPGLRYTGRLYSDPIGTMPQGEYLIVNGTAANSSNRYGDYSAMSVDPVDDCTFWFTGEYNASSQWSTRIASFKFDNCGVPDFTLFAAPYSQDVCIPNDTVYDIQVGQLESFSDPVSLSTVGAPAGATSSFSVNPVTPPGDSVLTLGTGGAAVGNYIFDVVGVAPTSTHTTTLEVRLFDAVPGAPTLLAPSDGAVNVSTSPSLSWSGNGISYTVEIATDAGFTNIVDTTVVNDTSYSGASLDPTTTYYWRVTAANVCGTGASSATWSFTTSAVPGECGPGTFPNPLYQTGFESGADGWTHSGTGDTWALSGANPHTGSTAFHADNIETASDQRLVSPEVVLPTGENPITLQFWNYQHLESDMAGGCYDGGLLEVSNNSGVTWTQAPDADLLTDPYDGEIPMGFSNPLAGLDVWCGDPQPYLNSIVDLSAYAGDTVRFRFRLGTDTSLSRPGWDIDDVMIQSCAPSGDIELSADMAMSGTQASTLTYTLSVTNTGLMSDVVDLSVRGNAWPTDFSDNSIPLVPGQTTTFTVSVTIPLLTPNGWVDYGVVSASSQGSGQISDATTLTTTVVGIENYLLLPVVFKNTP